MLGWSVILDVISLDQCCESSHKFCCVYSSPRLSDHSVSFRASFLIASLMQVGRPSGCSWQNWMLWIECRNGDTEGPVSPLIYHTLWYTLAAPVSAVILRFILKKLTHEVTHMLLCRILQFTFNLLKVYGKLRTTFKFARFQISRFPIDFQRHLRDFLIVSDPSYHHKRH